MMRSLVQATYSDKDLALDSIGGMMQQDDAALNLHLIDAIIDSTTIEGNPRDLGAALILLFGQPRQIVDTGTQVRTPMRKSIVPAWLRLPRGPRSPRGRK